MHDQQKKKSEVLSPEEKATAAAEHARVGAIYKAVLHTSKVHDYSLQTLDDTEKLLLAVPEAYTAYNCRRHALETIWKPADAHADAAVPTAPAMTRQEWLRKELKLNSTVLLMNYKNYNAFVHRHWVFDQIESLAKAELVRRAQTPEDTPTVAAADGAGVTVSATPEAVASPSADVAAVAPTLVLLRQLLQKERAQCENLLQLDERNFHAWNYRRWVLAQEHRADELVRTYLPPAATAAIAVAAAGTDAFFTADEVAELAYTTQKIKNNFSNYSAWHQRSLELKSAAARWEERQAPPPQQQQPTHAAKDASVTAAARTAHSAAPLLAQLHEDVRFLEQAIYCDPNDQSAWFYAPFVLQLLKQTRQTSEQAAEAAALTDALMHAVVELVAEVDRAGSADECYMPYYFLLDQLINLQTMSDKEARAAMARYTDALCTKVASLAAVAVATAEGEASQRQQQCFHFLYERLCKADVLRKGLYDDMLKRATQGTA